MISLLLQIAGLQICINRCNLITIFFFLNTLNTVISVPEQVAEKLEPSDDSSGPSYIDYSERRSLPISIPDCNYADHMGERYVVGLLCMCLVLSLSIYFHV